MTQTLEVETENSFSSAGIPHSSYVRSSKLFTANSSLIVAHSGTLKDQAFEAIREAVIDVFR